MPSFRSVFIVAAILANCCTNAQAQLQFDREPINYDSAPAKDPVAQLQTKLDAGQAELVYDEQRGYLPALLEQLDIRPSSQVLVKSKTSFQLRRISPKRPRALYFNDRSHVG